MAFTLKQLAHEVGGRVVGDADCVIERALPVDDSASGAISYVGSAKFARHLQTSRAEALVISAELEEDLKGSAIVVDNPRAAFAKITALLYPAFRPAPGIHETAVIDSSARIAATATVSANVVIEAGAVIEDGVYIGPGCVIGRDSVVGKQSRLNASVTVYHGCRIGESCIIHSATVIGADGFGFEPDNGEWLKIPQVGGVVIGNKVEIGACSTVDRGALKDTVIEDGVKLDNHIQIAHNVYIGANTVMSNGVGVAGSTRIGKNCLIGGMTGIKDNIEITDDVIITAMSLVSKPLTRPGSYSSNTPIDDTRTWRKNSARFRQLDELARKIHQLEKNIKE